ncbi:hypothetical protein EBB07_18325 [Paenibacillaceae bacterium]|nr:hypothetical protein EBB07_18325 [Paenibacillaceae bacterium]
MTKLAQGEDNKAISPLQKWLTRDALINEMERVHAVLSIKGSNTANIAGIRDRKAALERISRHKIFLSNSQGWPTTV